MKMCNIAEKKGDMSQLLASERESRNQSHSKSVYQPIRERHLSVSTNHKAQCSVIMVERQQRDRAILGFLPIVKKEKRSSCLTLTGIG